MNYQETIEWMFNQLPMYQNQGASAYKKDLTNTLLLAKYLGNPERNIKTVHVAGTNGKGSTSHLLAAILQEAGYKVGLYTSPHLKDYRERIKINGKDISEEYVCQFMNQHRDFFEAHQLSFFEMTVGLAFDYFANQKVDVAIIEVGMGGRLDSTNIITPLVSVVTNIGLDHTQFLGNTLELIAAEKAGIIKKDVPVVVGEYTPETKEIFSAKAKQEKAEIYYASDLIYESYPSALIGDYQVHNKKTVLQTIKVLNATGEFIITSENCKNGFLNVLDLTHLKGRWQVLQESPKVICDTAHNINGLEIVMNQLQKENFLQLHIVLGVVNDKDLSEIMPLFPKNAIYYFCKPNIPRGLDAEFLQKTASGFGLIGEVYVSVINAYKSALANASKNDVIYVGGSTFVVAEIV
ncbi:folylpolyglutamate synthase/dihydrofolate synthase family protein [Flavobacterium sp.]|uniref:bifunctional folylpolyglutamate synthase/dihydrofolate synthase n=1 Tax=Flavobacterium sp. TaxID=239 RepID=UPI00261294FE|nr:folylpolyglutamate synthase/dihydrofolate synthase family protein [Flavobacterium sp.]MDD3004958.1 bifunctional folylpolyglutamate synthase/dihydrofolate synthase [Flavobacterium sp.]